MLRKFFGEITSGKLARLPYFYGLVAILVVQICVVFGIVLVIGSLEHLVGGDLATTQQMLRDTFGSSTIIFMVAFEGAILFTMANIAAKRLRDMGLPGWAIVILMAVLSALVTKYVSVNAANLLTSMYWLLLLFGPTNLFKKTID